ncbi:uncharacterized protein BDR25DRAFT_395060 [Lindgomyces ingoldianus]|uniref:Uncharacterized protein n=1 Tax=Lindgomyces ingoldianus TaxID=673940 RepID=A0ACB6QLH0_9PLEO|nr:uncharacterized protein BDR25DRAFT_395060 [Lindgomyces ingoldianus]KAF2467854.1 hypothetical protein BDR25DRAFT_395060 [Lindgomyces ingoldianus]
MKPNGLSTLSRVSAFHMKIAPIFQRGSLVYGQQPRVDGDSEAAIAVTTTRHISQIIRISYHRTALAIRTVDKHQESDPLNLYENFYMEKVTEILSCGLAAISLIAIIITLKIPEGKLLLQWTFKITINALATIFTVLLKAGLAMPLSEGISQLKQQSFRHRQGPLSDTEGAKTSRGIPKLGNVYPVYSDAKKSKTNSYEALGCLRNLLKYFAKFAEFITILAFIPDPFAQQIVQNVGCAQIITGINSIISRTGEYNASLRSIKAGQSAIAPSKAVAINLGIYSPPDRISSLLDTKYKSGNCTFLTVGKYPRHGYAYRAKLDTNQTVEQGDNSFSWGVLLQNAGSQATFSSSSPCRAIGVGGFSEYAQGDSTIIAVFLKVQWAWLSFLTVLTRLAFTFFTVFLIQSPHSASDQVWKSSSLAVLFCALNDSIHPPRKRLVRALMKIEMLRLDLNSSWYLEKHMNFIPELCRDIMTAFLPGWNAKNVKCSFNRVAKYGAAKNRVAKKDILTSNKSFHHQEGWAKCTTPQEIGNLKMNANKPPSPACLSKYSVCWALSSTSLTLE